MTGLCAILRGILTFMFDIKKTALTLAAVLALSLASCSKGSSSSQTETTRSTVKPPVEADVSVPDSKDETPEKDNIGDKLRAAYNILTGEKYTYKLTLEANDLPQAVKIERYKSGSRVFQSQETEQGKRGFLSLGSNIYEFDYLTYSYTDEGLFMPDVIESVVKENLEQTASHIKPKDDEVAEEYTYMGDTYITVFDFYFDKKSGSLKRYTTTYSVEGDDDYVETRTITELSSSVGDERIFEPTFTTTLTDFSAFSSADRQTYCTDQCKKFGITEQNLVSNGMTYESFKRISYNDFVGLIYRRGVRPNEYAFSPEA